MKRITPTRRRPCRSWLRFIVVLVGALVVSAHHTPCAAEAAPETDVEAMPEPPPSPPQDEWDFIDALKAPIAWSPQWTRTDAASGEADVSAGVTVVASFPDPEGLLDTAYADFDAFLECVKLPKDGPYRIVTEKAPRDREAFTIVVEEDACRIRATDTEGIRRAIFFLEDQLMSADGPFLSLGEIDRSPFIHTRISRCFFGPIKRPPMNRDELADDVDYYPDNYLNRLAHDGVNGLWLTIAFDDLCKTSLVPNVSPDRGQRLAKLRRTVDKCRRYGIKVYIFCIEPRALPAGSPLLKAHPELAGTEQGSRRPFCPFSDAAQTYLYEATHSIFHEVPHLGGMITISLGERSTTCLTTAGADWKISACPTCAKKQPWEILRATLEPMDRGMRDANPDARLISWLYVPENGTGHSFAPGPLEELARHMPSRVLAQYNFESGGRKVQLGKERHAGDYWLSYAGPSDAFRGVASAAVDGGVEMSAKIQACCSHEVATVPYIPAPGLLYPKYQAMRGLGVTSVMQCWYFGNIPCPMNRAAATVLPFASGELSEDAFLLDLARRYWGPADAPRVIEAWRLFADAYGNYPLTNAFQYYGPMHDAIAWPLHLKPVHRVLSPTWRSDYPITGDRIGECFAGTHTYAEILELCGRMSETWNRGVEKLRALEARTADDPTRLNEIAVAKALGLQFRSGYNVLRFYDLREQLLYGGRPKDEVLAGLRAIVAEEIQNSRALALLCAENPFLGFHSEAECYRYFPEKLEWRAGLLRRMLDTEFAEAERTVAAGKDVFPERSGVAEGPGRYHCQAVDNAFADEWRDGDAWQALPAGTCPYPAAESAPKTKWQAAHDDANLYVRVACPVSDAWQAVSVEVHVESAHIYPRRRFQVDAQGRHNTRLGWLFPETPWEAASTQDGSVRAFGLRIPLSTFEGERDPARPMRINVKATYASRTGDGRRMTLSWAAPSAVHLRARLGYGAENPDEMGWLWLD